MAKDLRKTGKKGLDPPRKGPTSPDPGVLAEVERFLEEMEGSGLPLVEDEGETGGTKAAELQANWIAAGLGVTADQLKRRVAGTEAGAEAGQVFYGIPLEGGELLVGVDGLRAYLCGMSPERAREAQTHRVLGERGLKDIEVVAPDGGNPWIRVAQGRAPVAGRAGEVQFCRPGQPEERLSYQVLSLLSAELHQLFQASGFDQKSLPNISAMAAVTGQVLGYVKDGVAGQEGRDVFGRSLAFALESPQGRLEAGGKVRLSAEGEYRAEGCGYLCLADGRLSVLPPIWLDQGAMHAYWVLLDERPQSLSAEMVHQCLGEAGVVVGIEEELVAQLVAQVQGGAHRLGLHLLAQGTGPVNGQDAQVEILVDLKRRAGTEKPDGSIDFREVNFAPNVGAGQVIARRRPPTQGVPGQDVKGQVLAARDGLDQPLKAGINVETRLEEGVEVYLATIEGAARQKEGELQVVRQLAVKGNVDFSTGNLDFRGEVYIDGSVVQGFSVKATGTITIADTVENGSTVLSVADIVVSRGILGRRTRVQAGGSIRAQFVQEAKVEAGGDITIGNYVYHATLRAEGKVMVRKGVGGKGGVILGGEIWGHDGVEAVQIGSTTGVAGTIVVGLQPVHAQQLDRLKANISVCQEHLQKVLRKFNLTAIDLAQIRNMVAAATGPHRKVLLHHARQLGQLVQLYQKLQGEKGVLEGQIRTAIKDVDIKVFDMAFFGVTIRIGEFQRKLREDIKSPRFHLFENRLVER